MQSVRQTLRAVSLLQNNPCVAGQCQQNKFVAQTSQISRLANRDLVNYLVPMCSTELAHSFSRTANNKAKLAALPCKRFLTFPSVRIYAYMPAASYCSWRCYCEPQCMVQCQKRTEERDQTWSNRIRSVSICFYSLSFSLLFRRFEIFEFIEPLQGWRELRETKKAVLIQVAA